MFIISHHSLQQIKTKILFIIKINNKIALKIKYRPHAKEYSEGKLTLRTEKNSHSHAHSSKAI